MKKTILLLLQLMLLPMVASAYDFEVDGVYYNIINNEASVTYKNFNSSDSYSGAIIIPETVTNNGVTYSVTSIGGWAFSCCTYLTSVEIPNTITHIHNYSFAECRNLENIEIPNSVIAIGEQVFYKCYNLTSIKIGSSITSIGDLSFIYCENLENVYIADIASWCNINFGDVYSNPMIYAQHLFLDGTELTDLTIPSSITSIRDYAFYGCSCLTNVTIPNTVISIGNYAFYSCYGLKSIEIPQSVTTIGNKAFHGCSNLTSIIVSEDNLYYDSRDNCNCIIETSTNHLLKGCHNSFIPNSVISIGESAFSGCSGLKSVNIPNSIISIGESAFSGCSGLKSVNIPTSITSISYSMFYNCTGLTNINIPNSVVTIGNSAFYGCKGLTSIEIPNSVTSIGGYAFYGCTGLKNLFIGTSITSIGEQAFYSCYNISTLMITGEGEWQGVNIPLSTSPKLYIDSHVTGLSGAKAPHSDIFCFATTPPTCDNNSLKNYSGTLHVPASSLAAYFTAEYWSNFDNIVGDAIEPNITISQDSVEMELGSQFSLTANVTPSDASPNNITWISTNVNIATVNYGKVQSVGAGECDIIAQCLNKKAICHVLVKDTTVTITLSQHDAMLLPNHMIYITLIPNPIIPELSVISSDPSVAAARVVNNTVQVVGIKEGTTTITVGSVDGTAIPATCLVTVYTEPGDINCDGFVNISDVTSLIDYLLSGDDSQISTKNADVNGDDRINISDVTELIDYLLNGGFWPWEYETFNVKGVKFTMVRVKGGTFMMGATSEQGNDASENEYPIHQVTLSDYMIGQTEVTQQLWVALMGSNPSRFGGHMDRPVENVSWEQCQTFILKLNQLTGMTFRLPTEAEWEFAARGGNRSSGYKYSGSNDFDEVAWCDVSGSDWLNPKYGTHTAASLKPNELRLYDMSGNVWEWCQDKYGAYSAEDQINPTGAESGPNVWRGGAWDASASRSRVSCRQRNGASYYVGLRLAL